MNEGKRASTDLSNPSKKKKSGSKENKPIVVGDTLTGTLGNKSNASYTPLHTDASAFDATAVKEVRNFLLAPSHAAYLNRTWSTSRTLTENDISNPPYIVPLLYRDTTSNRRPVLAMVDSTTITYVVYGNGYRAMEKNHVLYELCETHGKAIVLGLCAYFGSIEQEKIDLQYRYILASLLYLYGPSLQCKYENNPHWKTMTTFGPPTRSNVRVLVVDGLSSGVKEILKAPNGVADHHILFNRPSLRYNERISNLAELSKWTPEPRGADGCAMAKYTYTALTEKEANPEVIAPNTSGELPEQKKGEEVALHNALDDAKDDAQDDAQEDDLKKKKKKKRKRFSSSDEEDSLSDSDSDVKSESSSEEEDESSKSGSETDDNVNSSDSDDVPVSSRAKQIMIDVEKDVSVSNLDSKSKAPKLESSSLSQMGKNYKRLVPKPTDPNEKKKSDNASSLRKKATDKLDRVLQMKSLFENSLSKELNQEVTSTINNLKSLSDEYKKEGKLENARALIDAQSELNRVLMKTVASLCRYNAHRKLATIMATLYESESAQFESVAQTMVSMCAQMEDMIKKRLTAGQEAEKVAGDLATS